ncbi:MAG: sigma-70 family RNA polymerase sigma factor [Duncaniella sp.]|nr:sigma-70 family RNA polymerase sigma factor [Duncaniella sp.]
MLNHVFQTRLNSLHSNMLNYALMLTSSREMASELLAHTTKVATRLSHGVSEQENFKSWVFAVMRDVFAGEYSRQAQPVKHTVSDSEIHFSEQGSSKPEGTFSAERVRLALERLTDGYRKIASMHFAGYTVAEIAEATGISQSTVKTRLADSRILIRMQLAV